MRLALTLSSLALFAACASAPPCPAPTPCPASSDANATAAPPASSRTEVFPEMEVEGVPALPARIVDRLRQYRASRSASFLDWSPGGGILVATRFGETTQVHEVATPLGQRTQLTFEAEPIGAALAATWAGRPGFFYLRDAGGSEAYQIFFYDRQAGAHRQVTQGKARNVGLTLSDDGATLVYASTARNLKDYDIYALDLGASDAAPRKLVEREGYWQPLDVSPDGRELLLLNYVSSTEATLHRLDVAAGAVTPLLPATAEPTANIEARYGKSAAEVWFVSNRWSSFRELGVLRAGDEPARAFDDVPWDVEALAVAPGGKTVAISVNEGGRSKVVLLDAKGRRLRRQPKVPTGVLRGLDFSADGARLAITIDSARGPADVYVARVRDATVARWTESEVGGLDTARFVEPTLIRYPTFDEVDGAPRQIPAFYFAPEGKGPHPVLVLIHGGPESQYRPYFSSTIQFLVVELGLAVIAPNVRGSAGYGKEYLLADNGFRREDSVKDIGALLDWIGAQAELDAARVGVYGGSYGGYMVLASMARFADQLVCGADMVGISNFVTFLENTKAYRRDLRRAEYGDERDPKMRAFLESISPTTLVGDIRDPLLVGQGLNDPRVPASEAEQIVAAVAAAGRPAWYVLARNEGHGFRKKVNRDYWYGVLALFLEEHLIGATAPSPEEGTR